MDSRTRSASPVSPSQIKREQTPPPQDKISAYYSLVFPHFTFYIQTLSVTIGRRCAPNPNTATSSTAEPLVVDVDLGALKSVSRLHAKIEYDQDEDRFVLVVIGRNGAWVDGVWSGSGTRAPLSERSQIQIASRTFHFVLPPPPPPEDTPSPSSQSSNNRARSPSLDITSISPPSSQPSHTPPPPRAEDKPLVLLSEHPPVSRPEPPEVKPLAKPISEPQLPNSNAIGKTNKATSKKRKKGDGLSLTPKPKPDEMPPKPPFTYAQLIYRAIKAIGGKATLHEICSWIMKTYDYYQYADHDAWTGSVRHNLSSRAEFKKLDRCGGDRGKGFFWKLDETHSQALEEQEARMQSAGIGGPSGGKDSKGRKKDKGASLLEPPLKRSVKGDLKGTPLPPPLTTTPLVLKTSAPSAVGGSAMSNTTQATTGVFAYSTHSQHAHMITQSQPSAPPPGHSGPLLNSPNPYAALTQAPWGWHLTQSNPIGSSPSSNTASASPPLAPSVTTTSVPSSQSQSVPVVTPPQPPDVIIPIVLGPIPPTHADYSPTKPNNSAKEGYMVLHERTLILDPDVFSGLTKERLVEIERMGVSAALIVLAKHMVRALKKLRRERGKGRGARKNKGTAKKGVTSASVGPFTNAPLERKPMAVPEADTSTTLIDPEFAPAKPTTTNDVPIADTVPMDISGNGPIEPGSPILVVDDSDDEGPAAKRRKVEEVVS